MEDLKNWLPIMENLKTVAFPDKMRDRSHEIWKEQAGEIQSHWRKTQGLNQRGLEGREEIKPPKFILMALRQYSDRYSEKMKQVINLTLEE
jgi:hypothetical protein